MEAMHTDPKVLEALVRATSYVMSPEELHAQRHSWVVGQMLLAHPEMGRDEADKLVAQATGYPIAAAPSPDTAGDGGDLGRQTGACLTAPGHSRAEPFGLGAAPECPSRIEAAAQAYYDGMIGKPETQWPHHDGWAGKSEAFKEKVRAHMARALAAAGMVSSPGFAAAIPSGNEDETFPIGFEDRIVSVVHPIMPDQTVVGWAFGDREFGLGEVKRIALAALAGEARSAETHSGSVHEHAADLSATPKHSPEPNPLMSVDEAREVLSRLVMSPLSSIETSREIAGRYLARAKMAGQLFAHASRIEAALRTLSENGEVR